MLRTAHRTLRSLHAALPICWQVFQMKCIQCHAVRGNGGHAGPELGPDHDLPHTSVQLATVLWNHAPAMIQSARDASMSAPRSEEHTSELQSRFDLVCRLLLE